MSLHPHNAAIDQGQILLVEDAVDLAQVIVRELEAAGYRVVHVKDGEAAVQVEKTAAFHLIILDWMLPDINGLEVLRRLRAYSAVSVLMLTARDSEDDRVMGLEVGADDYLTKPFSMKELIARVRALLRRRELIERTIVADQASKRAVLDTGRLRIEPDAYMTTIDGETVDLTRLEFALLYLLASNAGRVFNRAYLIDTLWGADYVDGDRSVDNAILRLRKKLKAVGDCIEAVWGVGYRWKRACQD